MKGTILCIGFAVVLLAGCATAPVEKARADLLDFLADNKTTREDVLMHLGQPSGTFESQRILTYQIGVRPKTQEQYVVERRTYPSGWPNWMIAKYSLVLVFDDRGILQKHSKVQVN